MITKRDLLTTLANRLNGGDVPDDLKGRYHPQVLERVLDMVFSELVFGDSTLMRELGVKYELTPTLVGTKYQATIPVPLAFNSKSLVLVYGCDENDWYIVRDGIVGNQMMNILKPSPARISVYQDAGVLYFTSKPHETVTMFAIPNVSAMEDDNTILLPGKESTFFMLAFQALRAMDAKPMEIINDQKPDSN